jgi:hypothetical protein
MEVDFPGPPPDAAEDRSLSARAGVGLPGAPEACFPPRAACRRMGVAWLGGICRTRRQPTRHWGSPWSAGGLPDWWRAPSLPEADVMARGGPPRGRLLARCDDFRRFADGGSRHALRWRMAVGNVEEPDTDVAIRHVSRAPAGRQPSPSRRPRHRWLSPCHRCPTEVEVPARPGRSHIGVAPNGTTLPVPSACLCRQMASPRHRSFPLTRAAARPTLQRKLPLECLPLGFEACFW